MPSSTTGTKSCILDQNFTQTCPHHKSLEALWETKWKPACKLSIYPFHHGNYDDSAPIFSKLIATGVNTAQYQYQYLVVAPPVSSPSICCRLLLVNGTMDGLMPMEDSMLRMEYGRPEEARFYPDKLHMGDPPANEYAWPWMEEAMDGRGHGIKISWVGYCAI